MNPNPINKEKIKAVAFDLDGTLSQHKTRPPKETFDALDALGKKYKLLMAGAGTYMRISNQLGGYPIDIIGNYGMQYAVYNKETKAMDVVYDRHIPCDHASVEERVTLFREKYGYTKFRGDNVQFHDSGCVTIPILGTEALQEDKLAFDPDRKKRRAIYEDVKKMFPDFTVFVGGSSSFDMAPFPYDKAYALHAYCEENGLTPDELVYVGDDYGPGGNDESVYLSDFHYLTIDDYRTFPQVVSVLL